MEEVIPEGLSEKVRSFRLLSGCLVVFLLSGCALFDPPVFTPEELRGVDTTVSYGEVLSDYRSLAGTKVVLGGVTTSVDNRTSRAYVQIDPAPLDTLFRPGSPGNGAGILLVFPYPVDPSSLGNGRKITVVGRVRRMKRPILTDSGMTVRRVTVDVLALHTWVPRGSFVGGPSFPGMAPGTGLYQIP